MIWWKRYPHFYQSLQMKSELRHEAAVWEKEAGRWLLSQCDDVFKTPFEAMRRYADMHTSKSKPENE